MSRFDQASNLLDWLDSCDLGNRPLVFITHSMGGLLVKEMLNSAKTFENQGILKQTKGIVFLATPHTGSHLAKLIDNIGVLAQTTVSVKELKAHDSQLRKLNEWYRENVRSLGIATKVYYETQPFKGILVVDEDSANPGIEKVKPVAIPNNHIDLCKPESQNSLVYLGVKKFIKECLNTPDQHPHISIQNSQFEGQCTHQQDIGWETSRRVEAIAEEYTHLFIGREDEQQQLDQFLSEYRSGVLIVTGGAGFGKSALLANWKQRQRKHGCFVVYHCFSYRYDKTRSILESYRNLLKQLFIYYGIGDQLLRSDQNSLRDSLLHLVYEHGSREGQPLVIILDGLDEAENPFDPPFLPALPEGVFVIASARAEAEEEPDYLRNWTDGAHSLHLKRLPHQAIPLWLKKKGGNLTEYARDENFIQELDEITDGFPLYLGFLIDELSRKQTENLRAILRQSPRGFSQYVKKQFKLLAKVKEVNKSREIQDLFALLSVALGALSEDDLEELTDLTSWDFPNLPWPVARWFSIKNNLYSFTHPLLAQEFQKALTQKQANSAKKKLIDYCSHWQEHQSPYALRHYAEHLQKAQQLEQLYCLARDKTFAVTQHQQILDEPDLSLKVVRTALRSAADTDDPVAMAEFMLLHAKRLLETMEQETPLDVMRRGNLERALHLADLYDTKLRVLWYLLLAWELKDESRFEEAQEILKKLIKNDLPLFLRGATDWQNNYATYLLTHVFEINQEVCVELHRKLLEHNDCCRSLCKLFIKYGDFSNAIKTAKERSSQLEKFFELRSIAVSQKRKGKAEAARLTLAEALEGSRKVFPHVGCIWEMTEIAELHAELGDHKLAEEIFNEAIETAQKFESQEYRVKALIEISNSQVNIGWASNAFKTLRQIQIDEQSQLEKYLKVKLLEATANLEARNGYLEQAKTKLHSAIKLAKYIENNEKKADALVNLVASQAEVIELVSALKTAKKIQDKWKQKNALFKIIEKYIEINDFTNALLITETIEDPFDQGRALKLIALKQAELKDDDGAIETAERAEKEWSKNNILVAIAIKQAEQALTKDDLEILKSNLTKVNEDRNQPEILSALSQAHARMRDFNSALNIVDSLESLSIRTGTRLSIAKIQVDACKTREARYSIAHELKPKQEFELSYLRSFFLAEVAALELESGQKIKAIFNAKSAYKIAKKINFKLKKLHSLALVSDVLAKAEDKETALKVLAHARKTVNGMKQKSYEDINCFMTIGVAQVKAGEFDAALDTLKEIILPYGQAVVLKNLAHKYKSTEQRKRIKESIDYVYENIKAGSSINVVRSQCDFAIALVETGDKEAGFNVLNDLCNQAEKLSNRSNVLSEVAIAEARMGEISSAWHKTTSIEDGWEQLKALEEIAWIQWRKEDREGLLKTLRAAFIAKEKIQDEQNQTRACKGIAMLQAMVGGSESKKAIVTAKMMPTEINQIFSLIAGIFANNGEKDNFKQLLIPCSYFFSQTYDVCRHLVSLYPEKTQDIVKVVEESC
ncbi:AAA family ATPase [Moorena sp. SIOASIH]|uniref:AAA family ATPase n=1 Tax=Moorena sp. SIOASIH TaxID=2607817 RepID=UPI0025CF3200|nr:AAA family ATPase [Moorena sp. SIOASIH]